MKSVNVHEAKTHLSRLLAEVEKGEEIVIARSGKPVARLLPLEKPAAGKRELGFDRGLFTIPDDFDETPEEIIADFEGLPDKFK
jgi:prevent-host-death family protein